MNTLIIRAGCEIFLYDNEINGIKAESKGMICWIYDRTWALDLVKKTQEISKTAYVEKEKNSKDFIPIHIDKLIDVFETFGWYKERGVCNG